MLNCAMIRLFPIAPTASLLLFLGSLFLLSFTPAPHNRHLDTGKGVVIGTDGAALHLIPLNEGTIRVIFTKAEANLYPDELIYREQVATPAYRVIEDAASITMELAEIIALFNRKDGTLTFTDQQGNMLLREKKGGRSLETDSLDNLTVYKVMQRFVSPPDEYLYGTGQFQDGHLNIRGLSRRLTQVNSQIAIPFILSSKGYGLLWNNYGLTEFNPGEHVLPLRRYDDPTETITVDATGTSGNRRETRSMNRFTASLTVPAAGSYALLLDVGQAMARKHHLVIDGDTLVDVNNIWLPPTTSVIAELSAGVHEITVEGEQHDQPRLYWRPVNDETVFYSPVAEALDYTVFAGNGEEVIASYRELTGPAPMLPLWAYGYIHCRERYHTQEELLENARTFRQRGLPLDVIVQDWQYWGKHGWNAMRFDEERYPDPAEMVRQLHEMNLHMMISVWSKIDKQSTVGKEMEAQGYYIPGSDWIDFFNSDAAAAYWTRFSEKMLPYGIDAWWLDATEPENDDLRNRKIRNGTLPGELLRNVYPLYVNRTVYEGLRRDDPERRAFILTRSAFAGMQRYGTATWSGDVGHDWETLRRQITAGLGQMSTGLPWWTYDAGGFFRPGDQYTSTAYHELFIRWFQTAAFFPLLRVHGYMSNTEPWRYGEEVEQVVSQTLDLRYRLLPYIYSEAARVSMKGSTLMRPLVMDFAHDSAALEQKHQFMFGPSLLVSPVTEPNVKQWSLYLPEQEQGWIDFRSGRFYEGGHIIEVPVDLTAIPLFVRAGAIIPMGAARQYASQQTEEPMEIRIYPGADATFTLYEDEGDNYHYEQGLFSTIGLSWDDVTSTLTIGNREGTFPGMDQTRSFRLRLCKPDSDREAKGNESTITLTYHGRKKSIQMN
ncbi:MAG: TIM-barrel domain-containing protein [Proteiniphilum sp.]